MKKIRKIILDSMPDNIYLKLRFRQYMRKKLNLKNPQSFNEKLQWLKLHDRNPFYTTLVDKYAVKKYVADLIGNKYIIPTFGVWDSFDEIDFDTLPNDFVLKCTHDSGGVIICHNKSTFNRQEAKEKLSLSLKTNFFKYGREWPYKNVPRRIIAEKFMQNNLDKDLKDYKFFCFNGKCKIFKIDFDRFTNHGANYYDARTKELLKFGEKVCMPNFKKSLEIPAQIDEMIRLAEKLSSDISFLRVDFYVVNNRIYFGELTFYPASGFGEFIPNEWDEKLGDMIRLDD